MKLSANGKLWLFVIALFAACIAAALFMSGCATGPDGKKVLDSDRVAQVAGSAAYIGGVIHLAKHPDDRPIFQGVIQILTDMEARAVTDPAALANAVSCLNIRELRGDHGYIYVEGALVVYDIALATMDTVLQNDTVRKVTTALRIGLQRAMEVAQ